MASPFARQETPLVPPTEPGASSVGECGNCRALLTGPYCSQCGEKKLTPKDYSLPHLVEEVLGVFTHLDSKFLRTLKVLFTKPGELSNAYFHGGRSRYTKPLTLFVIINVIFFIVQPHTGLLRYKYLQYINNPSHAAAVRAHLLESREPERNYAARFNANLQNQKKSLLIVSVPVLAVVMAILFMGAGKTYVEHLVFSVQVYTFLLSYLAGVVLLVLLPAAMLLRTAGPRAESIRLLIDSELGITAIVITGLTVYMFLGFQRAYGSSKLRAALSGLVLAWTIGLLTGVYHDALFYVTFWTT